jgi:glycerol-3-phosphate acyltransferase PlsY
MLILVISDSLAALIGKSIGKIKIGDKTLEGTLAFVISATAIAYVIQGNFLESLFVAVCVGVLEVLPLDINDNITIPLWSGVLFNII